MNKSTLTSDESIAILNGVAHAGRQDWQSRNGGAVSFRRDDYDGQLHSWLDGDTLYRVALSYQLEMTAVSKAV